MKYTPKGWKNGICGRCGKQVGPVPPDATEIRCFACNEAEMDERDRERNRKRDDGK